MLVYLNHWMGCAGATALQGAGLEPGLQEVTAEQIVALRERFDVMLTSPNPGSQGDTPMLWVDERGKRFRQR